MELNQIINGDCLEVMKGLPDKCIDLIITSPPYNLGKTHHTGNNRFKSYSQYNDDMPEELYQQWQIEILNECYRVLKQDGSMWYNHKNRIRNGILITPYEWLLKTKFTMKQEIVWFNGSQNFDKCRFYPMTERLYWLTKSPKTKMFNSINHHDVFDKKDWPPVGTKGKFKRAFPEKMVEDIISCFPNTRIVLDIFSGSGTTCAVAKRMGKQYIGIDISEEYCEIARRRISKHVKQPAIFGVEGR
jgi:site-specific DNA-methyltransferase (adenine-specific)